MSEPRLIDVSTSLVAPDLVVRELRTIDSRAELLYIGRGKWWLGLVYDSIPLMESGKAELDRIAEAGTEVSWATIRLSHLKRLGFRRVIMPRERWPREPMWRFMIEWFRRSDFCFRHIPDSDQGWEDAFKPHERAMTNADAVEEAKKRLVEYVHQEKQSLMRRVQHNPWVAQGQADYRRAINQ